MDLEERSLLRRGHRSANGRKKMGERKIYKKPIKKSPGVVHGIQMGPGRAPWLFGTRVSVLTRVRVHACPCTRVSLRTRQGWFRSFPHPNSPLPKNQPFPSQHPPCFWGQKTKIKPKEPAPSSAPATRKVAPTRVPFSRAPRLAARR